MSSAVITMPNKRGYSILMSEVLRYARTNTDVFTFGPLTGDDLVAQGLTVTGEVQGLVQYVSTTLVTEGAEVRDDGVE